GRRCSRHKRRWWWRQRARQCSTADGHNNSGRPHSRRPAIDFMRRLLVLLSAISLCGGSLLAQLAEMNGPIEGFIFDAPTGSFRAVIGMPGSASLGPPILDGFSRGSVAPRKDYGLAFKDGKCALVSGLGSA